MPTPEESKSMINENRVASDREFLVLAQELVGYEKDYGSRRHGSVDIRLDPDERNVRFQHHGYLDDRTYWYKQRVICEENGDVKVEDGLSLIIEGREHRELVVRRDFKEGKQVGEVDVMMVCADTEGDYYTIRETADGLIRQSVRDSFGDLEPIGEPKKLTEEDRVYWAELNRDFLEALSGDVDTQLYSRITEEIIERRLPEDGYVKFETILSNRYDAAAAEYETSSPPLHEMSGIIGLMISRSEDYPIGHEQVFRFGGREVTLGIKKDPGQSYPTITYAYGAFEMSVDFEDVEGDVPHIRSAISVDGKPVEDYQVVDTLIIESLICRAMATAKRQNVLQVLDLGDYEVDTVRVVHARGYTLDGEDDDLYAYRLWSPGESE